MDLIPLSNEERLSTGLSHKIVIRKADLTAAAASQSLNLPTLAVGQFITRVCFRLVTAFVSANGTALGLELGNASGAAAYMVSKNVQTAGGFTNWFSQIVTTPPTGAAFNATAEVPLAKFTTTGGTTPLLTDYTAGEVHVFLGITDVAKL